ncbi:magnesium transporter [Candidatus Dojkabacteria bacterium]|uniref:Magnesium transporter n=1 Tax=Candidatus Dojkabacteria bacterium TaxID=2099670 RepID=A0A955RHE3_9BACT|nr:magnesium transporter [Candidatus Dojkabacteria bacterium]
MKHKRIYYADDDTKTVFKLFKLRIFSLVFGLIFGLLLSFSTSRFELVLEKDVSVAFFIPFIVYLSDAVGTQTQNIYSRDLKTGHAVFKHYLVKESLLGLFFGITFAVIIGPIVLLWLHSSMLAWTVAISILISISFSPIIALLVTELFQLRSIDPAVGSGPIATVLQDTFSIMVYGIVASAIFL